MTWLAHNIMISRRTYAPYFLPNFTSWFLQCLIRVSFSHNLNANSIFQKSSNVCFVRKDTHYTSILSFSLKHSLSLSLSLYSSTVWPDWVIFDDLGDILNTLVNNFGNTSQNLVRFWTIFEMTKITFCHLDHCDWNVGYFSPKQPGHTLILKHSISYITHFYFIHQTFLSLSFPYQTVWVGKCSNSRSQKSKKVPNFIHRDCSIRIERACSCACTYVQ